VLEPAQMLMWLPACLNLQLVEPAWLLLGSVWALPACLHPAEGTHQTKKLYKRLLSALK